MNKLSFLFLSILTIVLYSCNNNMKGQNTHSSGEIDLFIEESYKPLFETSIYTYEGQFPHADIKANYLPENKVIEALLKKKTSTICITRPLNESELAELKKRNIEVRTDQIAKDAVALIVHPENKDSLITIDELKSILKGETKVWKTSKTPINIVFDNENSANFNYLKEFAGITDSISKNIFAVKSNEEVIEHVKKNKNSIGIIGVNWISDQDDPEVMSFRKGLKIVGVSTSIAGEYFLPYQSYIYTDEYPLTRSVYMINYAGRQTLNSGFVNFMVTEKGQLIIQKSALIPANMKARLIEIKSE